MRQIANNVYIPVLKDLVEEGKEDVLEDRIEMHLHF